MATAASMASISRLRVLERASHSDALVLQDSLVVERDLESLSRSSLVSFRSPLACAKAALVAVSSVFFFFYLVAASIVLSRASFERVYEFSEFVSSLVAA